MDNPHQAQSKLAPGTTEIGIQFLLAEYESIRAFKEQSVEISDKRVDLFLTFFSVMVAGFGLLAQSQIVLTDYLYLMLAMSAGLLMIGVTLLRQVVWRDILITDYLRSINRIRDYFAQNAPEIQPFLLMPTSAKYPRYDWVSSNRHIPIVINALLSGMMGGACYMLMTSSRSIGGIAIAVGGIVAIIAYIIERTIVMRIFAKAELQASAGSTVSGYLAGKQANS